MPCPFYPDLFCSSFSSSTSFSFSFYYFLLLLFLYVWSKQGFMRKKTSNNLLISNKLFTFAMF